MFFYNKIMDTTLDLKAYSLYYDYCVKNFYKVIDVSFFIQYKDDEYFQKFYKKAIKQLRTEKLNNINNGTDNT